MLPKEQPHSVVLNREELRGAIERVAQFSDERSRAIRVSAAAGEVKIHSSVSETGESEESIPVEYDGRASRSASTRNTCWIFCARSPTEQVTFLFKDPHSAGEMRPGGEKPDNYRYVIMPMRI